MLDTGQRDGSVRKCGKAENLRPVAGSGQTDTLGTVLQGEDFTAVHPGGGGPREAVNADEDVAHGDDSLCRVALNRPLEVFVA